MIPRLLVLVLIGGCSTGSISHAEKPTGEEVFDLLLQGATMPLSNEPLCNVKSFTRENENINLGEHFSTNLSLSYESENDVTISSSCEASKHELPSSQTIDVWDCEIAVLESSQDGDFVSSSLVMFSTDLGKSNIISGSIRCQ